MTFVYFKDEGAKVNGLLKVTWSVCGRRIRTQVSGILFSLEMLVATDAETVPVLLLTTEIVEDTTGWQSKHLYPTLISLVILT